MFFVYVSVFSFDQLFVLRFSIDPLTKIPLGLVIGFPEDVLELLKVLKVFLT